MCHNTREICDVDVIGCGPATEKREECVLKKSVIAECLMVRQLLHGDRSAAGRHAALFGSRALSGWLAGSLL
jgi:hypothetical protein